jgi:hypothetical protein
MVDHGVDSTVLDYQRSFVSYWTSLTNSREEDQKDYRLPPVVKDIMVPRLADTTYGSTVISNFWSTSRTPDYYVTFLDNVLIEDDPEMLDEERVDIIDPRRLAQDSNKIMNMINEDSGNFEYAIHDTSSSSISHYHVYRLTDRRDFPYIGIIFHRLLSMQNDMATSNVKWERGTRITHLGENQEPLSIFVTKEATYGNRGIFYNILRDIYDGAEKRLTATTIESQEDLPERVEMLSLTFDKFRSEMTHPDLIDEYTRVDTLSLQMMFYNLLNGPVCAQLISPTFLQTNRTCPLIYVKHPMTFVIPQKYHTLYSSSYNKDTGNDGYFWSFKNVDAGTFPDIALPVELEKFSSDIYIENIGEETMRSTYFGKIEGNEDIVSYSSIGVSCGYLPPLILRRSPPIYGCLDDWDSYQGIDNNRTVKVLSQLLLDSIRGMDDILVYQVEDSFDDVITNSLRFEKTKPHRLRYMDSVDVGTIRYDTRISTLIYTGGDVGVSPTKRDRMSGDLVSIWTLIGKIVEGGNATILFPSCSPQAISIVSMLLCSFVSVNVFHVDRRWVGVSCVERTLNVPPTPHVYMYCPSRQPFLSLITKRLMTLRSITSIEPLDGRPSLRTRRGVTSLDGVARIANTTIAEYFMQYNLKMLGPHGIGANPIERQVFNDDSVIHAKFEEITTDGEQIVTGKYYGLERVHHESLIIEGSNNVDFKVSRLGMTLDLKNSQGVFISPSDDSDRGYVSKQRLVASRTNPLGSLLDRVYYAALPASLYDDVDVECNTFRGRICGVHSVIIGGGL